MDQAGFGSLTPADLILEGPKRFFAGRPLSHGVWTKFAFLIPYRQPAAYHGGFFCCKEDRISCFGADRIISILINLHSGRRPEEPAEFRD